MGVKDRIKSLNEQAKENDAIIASAGSPSSSNANSLTTSLPQSFPAAASTGSVSSNKNGDDNELRINSQAIDSPGQGAEILDSAISTTSSAKLDKTDEQLEVFEDASRNSKSIPPIAIGGGEYDDLEHGARAIPQKMEETPAPTKETVGGAPAYYATNRNDALPPMTHVDSYGISDDVSSLFVEEDKSKRDTQVQALPVHYEDDSIDEHTLQALKRRNIIIIILLLLFLGLVCAIGAGIIMAVKNNPNDATEDKYGGLGGGIDTDDRFATAFPSSAPSYAGPCIGVEVGIIFDRFAMETSWKLLVGESEEVIWQSDTYGSDWNNDWDVFRKCFPPGIYTFVFMDSSGDGICCSHGTGEYVLSSEGKVIAVGGEMDSDEERTTFELEYVEPEPVDSNGDGLDDRLGVLMPYDSSNLIEGETCENFRLVFETDQYGIETKWELYEVLASREQLIANGGPYGSEETYVYNYCLASQKRYALYMYDWKGDGLCCGFGQGWYKVTSRDIVIHQSDGKFGEEEVVRFVLPADGTFIETDAPVATPAPSWSPTPLSTQSPSKGPTPISSLPPIIIFDLSNLPTPPPTPPPFTLPFITFPPSAAPISQDTTPTPTEASTSISTSISFMPTESPSVAPISQDTTPTPTEALTSISTNISFMPTESFTTISTTSPTPQQSQIAIATETPPPTTQLTTLGTLEMSIRCPFCVGVEMKKPDLELAAGQTCQTVQDKANTLTIDDPSCELLTLVEASCCRPR